MFMKLETARLKLIDITLDDINNIHYLHSLPDVDRYNTLGIPYEIKETEEIIKKRIEDSSGIVKKSFFWKIVEKDSEEFIGEAGLRLSADRFKLGEIFYNILPEYWSKGYATETAKRIIKFGFEELNLHKVEAGVATENIASIKVLEKCGMTREGLRRKILPIRGEWKDNYHYAIVEDDNRNY